MVTLRGGKEAVYPDYPLRYATNQGGSWAVEYVSNPPGPVRDCTIALDPGGSPHIVAHGLHLSHAGEGAVFYATRMATAMGTPWIIDTVTEEQPSAVAFALDPTDGAPRVVFAASQSAGDRLFWATRLSDDWTQELVADHGSDLGYASLAIDAGGVPHVAYEDFGVGYGQLRYASRGSEGWTTEIPDEDTPGGAWTSIDAAENVGVHVSYLYVGDDANDLRHATRSTRDGVDQERDGVDG